MITLKIDFRFVLCVGCLLFLAASTSVQNMSVDRLTHVLIEPTASQFYTANPPPGGSGGSSIWVGTPTAGYYVTGGHVESWDSINAEFSLQGSGSLHGLIVHTTGTEGMAVTGWSSTGAQGIKGIQDTHFNSAVATFYRSGVTTPSDAPALEVNARSGGADLFDAYGDGGNFGIDHMGAIHLPQLADGVAKTYSIYLSNSGVSGQETPMYKNSAGTSLPLISPVTTTNTLNFAPAVIGTTGGGSTHLDGVATVSLPPYYSLVIRQAGSLKGWVLYPDSEASGLSGSKVTPLDHSSSNLRTWVAGF